MAAVQIEEQDFQRSETLRKTVAAMLQNPTSRRKLLEGYKVVAPNASIPEIDAAKPIEDKFEALQKQIEEDRSERKAERAKDEDERKLAKLRADHEKGRQKLRAAGYTDEGINGIEELMDQKGLLDHEDAAVIFDKKNPPADPAKSSGFGSYNFFETQEKGDDEMKRLIASKGEDEGLLRTMINSALTDVRGQSRR